MREQWINLLALYLPLMLVICLVAGHPRLFYFPRILILLFIFKPHKQRLEMQILDTKTMQWITYYKLHKIIRLIRLTNCNQRVQHWASRLMGANFSSDPIGDGARSKTAIQKRNQKRRKTYSERVDQHRTRHLQERSGHHPIIKAALVPPTPTPIIGSRTRRLKEPKIVQVSASTETFYAAHVGQNRWLTLEQGNNITGQQHQYGVKAKQNIPPSVRLAPYIGRIRHADSTGPYCLRTRDEENADSCLDAKNVMHDLGYMHNLSKHRRDRMAAEPNYGRYFNSLTPLQILEGYSFNAIILPDAQENFSWICSNRSILSGEEILVDYGDQYWPKGPAHPPVDDVPDQTRDNTDTEQDPTQVTGIPTVSTRCTHPSGTCKGKEHSSNNMGDGPSSRINMDWIRYLDFTTGLTYEITEKQVMIYGGRMGIRIKLVDIDNAIHQYAGRTFPAVPISIIAKVDRLPSDSSLEAWPLTLHAIYTATWGLTGINVFLRLLTTALETLLPDTNIHLAIVAIARGPPIVTWPPLSSDNLTKVMQALRLGATTWTSVDNEWCIMGVGMTQSLEEAITAPEHVMSLDGQIERIQPCYATLQGLYHNLQEALQANYGPKPQVVSMPNQCEHHVDHTQIEWLNMSDNTTKWWHRRLFQHLPAMTYEVHHNRIKLYYGNIRISILQSSLTLLHKTYVMTPGKLRSELADQLQLQISYKKQIKGWTTINPLTASFLSEGHDLTWLMDTTAGRLEFTAYLDRKIIPLYRDTMMETSARDIIRRTAENPLCILSTTDHTIALVLYEGNRITDPGWQIWKTCCPTGSWLTLRPNKGQHGYTIGNVKRMAGTTGLAFDGTDYFAANPTHMLKLTIDMLSDGLKDSLRNHVLTPDLTNVPPSWKTHIPATLVLSQWQPQSWTNLLPHRIRQAPGMVFWLRNVSVTLDPWQILSALQQSPEPTVHWLGQRLKIADIGYIEETDRPMVQNAREVLGLLRSDPDFNTQWIADRHIWSQRGWERATRYLSVHNPSNPPLADIDMDLAIHLTQASNPGIVVWGGVRHLSLARWMSAHPTSLDGWMQISGNIHWTIGKHLQTAVPPIDDIMELIQELLATIALFFSTQRAYASADQIWQHPQHDEIPKMKESLDPNIQVNITDRGTTVFTDGIALTILHESPIFHKHCHDYALINRTAQWTAVELIVKGIPMVTLEPSAFLVAFHIISGSNGERLLNTTSGRQHLRTFAIQELLPRLKTVPTDMDDPDTEYIRLLTQQAFRYLHKVIPWLQLAPNTEWTQGGIAPTTLHYILHDDPEITIWRHARNKLKLVQWPRFPLNEISLHDMLEAMISKWHIGYLRGTYFLFDPNSPVITRMGRQVMQLIRCLRCPHIDTPTPLYVNTLPLMVRNLVLTVPPPVTETVAPLPDSLRSMLRSDPHTTLTVLDGNVHLRRRRHGVLINVTHLQACISGITDPVHLFAYEYFPMLNERTKVHRHRFGALHSMAITMGYMTEPLLTPVARNQLAMFIQQKIQPFLGAHNGTLTSSLHRSVTAIRNSTPDSNKLTPTEVTTLLGLLGISQWHGHGDNGLRRAEGNGDTTQLWHVGTDGDSYFPIQPDCDELDHLQEDLLHRVRMLQQQTPPSPNRMGGNLLSPMRTGGGHHPCNLSTETHMVLTLPGHTLTILLSDVVKWHEHMQEEMPPSDVRQYMRDHLPIRYSRLTTDMERNTTPDPGYSSLYALARIDCDMAPDTPISPSLKPLGILVDNLLQNLLSQVDNLPAWNGDLNTPLHTCMHLQCLQALISHGHKSVPRHYWLPQRSMELLVQVHTEAVMLWTPDPTNIPAVVASVYGSSSRHVTIAALLSAKLYKHIAYNQMQYFEIQFLFEPFKILTDMALRLITEDTLDSLALPTPYELDAGSIFIKHTKMEWGMAISRHGIDCHMTRATETPHATLLERDAPITLHVRNNPGIWDSTDGNGYCGYVALAQLGHNHSGFDLRNRSHRTRLQLYLQALLLNLLPTIPEETLTRIRNTIAHLEGDTHLHDSNWCTLELAQYATRLANHKVWLPSRAPLRRDTWLSVTCTAQGRIQGTRYVAYNGTDHFSLIQPCITDIMREEAYEVLDAVLHHRNIPLHWTCVRGLRSENTATTRPEDHYAPTTVVTGRQFELDSSEALERSNHQVDVDDLATGTTKKRRTSCVLDRPLMADGLIPDATTNPTDQWMGSDPSNTPTPPTIGGGGIEDLSTDMEIVFAVEGHTIRVERRNIQSLSHGIGTDTPEARRFIIDHLPLTFGFKHTTQQYNATPGHGLCGLYALDRLTKRIMSTTHQSRDIAPLGSLIQDTLLPMAQANEWHDDTDTPQLARDYLHRLQHLLALHRSSVERKDWMPLESMQLFVQRHPEPVSLWSTDFKDQTEVLLTTVSGHHSSNMTMRTLTRALHSRHIAFSAGHFFEINIQHDHTRLLLNKMLRHLTIAQSSLGTLTPQDVDAGAVLVQHRMWNWGIGMSKHDIQCHSRGSRRIVLGHSPVTMHMKMTEAVWEDVAGDGYCGYVSLWRQAVPTAPHFEISNLTHRSALQRFLRELLSSLPPESPPEIIRRTNEAIRHLDQPTILPMRSWCHADLVVHVASIDKRCFWQPNAAPIYLPTWLGLHRMDQRSVPTPGRTIAHNGVDHFTNISLTLSARQRAEAYDALERAINRDPLPHDWECIRGTRISHGYHRDLATIEQEEAPTESRPSSIVTNHRTKPVLVRSNPILERFYPPPALLLSEKKKKALAAVALFKASGLSMWVPPTPIRERRAHTVKTYLHQLEFVTKAKAFVPNTSIPPPPRKTLSDNTSENGLLYVAPSRMEHSLMGVYSVGCLPFQKNKHRLLCEFRSERGHYLTPKSSHAEYLTTRSNTKDVVIRGHLLVDASGNEESYCTHIQENLKTTHFNCAYSLRAGRIWIVQTARIEANEELSIQYSKNGSYWLDREHDYHVDIYKLACLRYGLPVPPVVEQTVVPQHSHPLVGRPKFSSEGVLGYPYYHKWPVVIPDCSMRIATLNVNGALHLMTLSTSDTIAHLMEACQITILGITDARIPQDRDASTKRAFHHSLPQGMAVIPFCTTRPSNKSHRLITMGGQAFIVDRQWEKWVGHHRSDPSGLALVCSIRVTYNRTELSIIQVMIPPRSEGAWTMWQRLELFLTKAGIHLKPDEYVIQTAERWAAADRMAGRTVILMGDFNKPLSRLNEWAELNDLTSLGDNLLIPKVNGVVFASWNGTGTAAPSLIDHIFLSVSKWFKLTSIGGTMHPLLANVTDHNIIWVGLLWPDTPPPMPKHSHSVRITNFPDLPAVPAVLEEFTRSLDDIVEDITWTQIPIEALTPEEAGRIQSRVVRASVDQARLLSPPRIIQKPGKRRTFKDGFSPEYLLLKASLHAHIDIRRLIWSRSRKRYRHDVEKDLTDILCLWDQKRRKLYMDTTPHPLRRLFPWGRMAEDFRDQDLNTKIYNLRSQMHGRQRKKLRMAMSDRIKDMETLLTTRKLKTLIQRLIPTSSEPINFNELKDAKGRPFRSAKRADRAAANTMKDWMGVPINLNPIARSFEDDPNKWLQVLNGTILSSQGLPEELQRRIVHAADRRPISDEIRLELHRAMHDPFTFEDFETQRKSLTSGKSPGPSGLTTTQMKHWGPITARYVYDLSSLMWQHHHVPDYWQDRLMTLLPKEQGIHDLNKIRPISLFEIIRKMWAGMVSKRVQRVWHRHSLLHPNQHGFRPQHGTHTAILHVLNRLEQTGDTSPLHITFWDIRRAFDSVPKWLQRLSWARLGLDTTDLEWFLNLDKKGSIILRTPHQQATMKEANSTQLLAGSPMLTTSDSAFHPARGIGQGDTPSTLIFIAAFDILLTLLEESATGESQAYADDLAHMALTLSAQQRQADLVCGFCAYTGLEISISKVEAISINYGKIMYDTPFLTLHDWEWKSFKVQHTDNGFWTRYLGLYLDKHASAKHFTAAKAKLKSMCHALQRRVAPADAKKLVYTLCIKPQIRYPAGLAPWTMQQYRELDNAPTALLRHIYGLRCTFPTDLIYAPIDSGGCGEARISDAAQLQKWSYLQSVAHNGISSTQVVTDLINRAKNASVTDPSFYCSSIVAWGKLLGVELTQADDVPTPLSIRTFVEAVKTTPAPILFTDGSFAISEAPLLSTLTHSRSELTQLYGKAATGLFIPATTTTAAIALRLTTPPGRATDAFYQELLGIAMGSLLAQSMHVVAYSDCQSAIRRFRHARNPIGSAFGHLQYGPLLHGIRLLGITSNPHSITWTKAHPERTKTPDQWTAEDKGIHMADQVAGGLPASSDIFKDLTLHQCDAEDLLASLIPQHTWIWKSAHQKTMFKDSLKNLAQRHHFQQYLNKRDITRIHRNKAARWNQYCPALMASLTSASAKTPARTRGRQVKSMYDWMAHASNLAKGAKPDMREQEAKCLICGRTETQAHINTSCSHPAMQDHRLLLRNQIEEHFLCLQHTHLPPAQRWIRLLMDFAEVHLWEDSELAGDIWNGRWSSHTIHEVLGEHGSSFIPEKEHASAIYWLSHLTTLLQKAQTSLNHTRRKILKALSSDLTSPAVIHLNQSRSKKRSKTGPRQQTLFKAWKKQYSRRPPRRTPVYCKGTRPPATPEAVRTQQHLNWIIPGSPRHSTAERTKATNRTRSPATPAAHKCPIQFSISATKVTQREDHRTAKLKLVD